MNKYQTGNKILPTAQYASIKYDRGTKHIYPNFVWDSKLDPKKDIRGVRANNPLYSSPGEITREILYSPSTNQPVDTTYREYPTALLPVKIQTRVASSNDQDRKEYEILKRRFNTAWRVSRPHIRYGIFKEGGMIPKYQLGRHIWRSYFDYDPNKGVFIGKKTKNEYKALDAYNKMRLENWSKSYDDFYDLNNYHSTHKSKYVFTPNIQTNYSQQQQLIDYAKRTGININDVVQPTTKIYTSNNSNSFQWKPEFWAKIGNFHKGIKTPEEYGKYFDEWFKISGINPKYRDEVFKKNWEQYQKLGFSKLPSSANNRFVPKQTSPASEEFDLSENNPLVQEFLNKNGYVKSTPTDVSKNGNTAETIKPEPETIKPEEQKQVTYSDILLQNTDTIKNSIFNSGWRGAFKDSLNRALQTPDYYNNGEGTQVFDFELPDGTIINYDYLSGNGLLNKHGLLKAGAMRKLAKNFRQQGRNIAQQRYVGIDNQQISPNATPSIVNASIVNGGQPIIPVVNGQVATEINSFGLDKANGYPNITNSFNGTSDIDPNAAYRAQQELENQKRLNG